MSIKFVSIIIPTWNRSKELEIALNCISSSSSDCNFEIIISDDGSTDKTIDFLKKSMFRYVYEENSGLPSIARNRALRIASGNVFAFCDSDDYWLPEKLSLQLKNLNSRTKMVCSNAYLDDSNKTYFDTPTRVLTLVDLLKTNFVICSSVVVEADLFKRCGFFDESPNLKAVEDYYQWLKISLFTNIYYIQDPLLRYTTNSNNSVRKNNVLSEEARYRRILKKLIVFSLKNLKLNKTPIITYFYLKSLLTTLKSKIRENIKYC